MHKKYLLLFYILFFGMIQSVSQTIVITLPKNITRADDMLKVSFPNGQYQNKKYYLELAIYMSSKLIFTGTSNIFSIADNKPEDIFFTQFSAKDSVYAALSSSSDLHDGNYQLQYRISSLVPKAIIVSQIENLNIGKKNSVKKAAVKKEQAKPETKKEIVNPAQTEIKKENGKAIGGVEPGKDSVTKPEPPSPGGIKLSGYVDAYYAFYTDSTGINEYVKFPSIAPRSNHIGLNTAMITAQYDGDKYRGLVSLHFGDIARSAWSVPYNPIMEAHAGILLKKNLWLDGGFFRTHFGTEGLLPKENLTSSVSVGTFYEPYYESGFRLNYTPTDKLAINLYLLNGYNLYEDNNNKKSLGMLITYAMNDKENIGYSNYIGDDSPKGDSINHTRIHQNFFWNYTIWKIKLQAGGDYCLQQNSNLNNPNKMGSMYSGVFTIKYAALKNISIWERTEVFSDPQGFMSGIFTDDSGRKTGFRIWGETLGLQYKTSENSYLKLEGRTLLMNKEQKIYRWNATNRNFRSEITFCMGVSF